MSTSIVYLKNDAHIAGQLSLPRSKSISNRLLIIKALCNEDFNLLNLAQSTDTNILFDILKTFEHTASTQQFDVGDAGTSFRFLTAFFAGIEEVDIILKGTPRMHQRPISQLVDALNELGAEISYLEQKGFPPLQIKGKKLSGGEISMNGEVSSQYISALCLIAPTLRDGLKIELLGKLVSAPYLDMTLQLMAKFGIEVYFGHNAIEIKPQTYFAHDYVVEADWSSVCFFYAMAMISNTAQIHCKGLQMESIQGDVYIQKLAKDFAIETTFVEDGILIAKENNSNPKVNQIYDLGAYPDLAIPIIVACGIRYPKVKFRGLHHLIYKESNRIQALQNELAKAGIQLIQEGDLLSFTHTESISGSSSIYFETYNDHRMAMALSLFALVGYTVILDNVTCVQKSFPDYFEQLALLGFEMQDL